MRAKFFYGFLVCFCVLGVAWWWMQKATMSTLYTNAAKSTEKEEEIALYQYRGKYVAFDLPDIFQESAHNLPESGPVKESIFFTANKGATHNEKLAITLEEREEKTFDASPSYQMRKGNALYEEYSDEERREVTFIKKVDSYERTVFFFWEQFLVSISYTAPGENRSIDGVMTNLKKSFEKWLIEGEKKS